MVLRNAFGELALDRATPSGAHLIGNAKTKFRDGFSGEVVLDPDVWYIENDLPDANDGLGLGHIVKPSGNAAGASYLRISLSPFTDNSQVRLSTKEKFRFPTRVGFGITTSQRIVGQDVFFGLVEADDSDPIGIKRTMPTITDKAITGGGTVTSNILALTVPNHGFISGDRVILIGCPDSRMNVGPVIVTVTGPDFLSIPLTITNGSYTVTGGFVRHADPASRADNAVGLLLENATTTNATFVGRRNKGKYRLRNSTVASTGNAQGTSASFSDAFISGSIHELFCSMDEVSYRSFTADGNAGMAGLDKYHQGIPDEEADYRIHIRARNLDEMSRPIAQITSIAKSGSTTVTVTTDRPHGLTTGSRVGIYGVRDQTAFPNTSDVAIASVPSTTTFTYVGVTGTVTDTNGGVVFVNHGQVNSPGAFNFAIQSLARDAAGVVTVTLNTTASGFAVGEYVHLWGLNGAGAAVFDGAYKVLNSTGATILLEPYTGLVVGSAVASITTGGAVIRRTDVRLHFARVLDHTRILTEIIGGRGNLNDGNNGVPVTIAAAPQIGVRIDAGPTYFAETVESTTALAANGLYSGAARDMGTDTARRPSRHRVQIRHLAGTTHGHVYLEQSTDNTTFFETWRQPIPSDGYMHTFEVPMFARYYRWRFQNGATAQTAFFFNTNRVFTEGTIATEIDKVLIFPSPLPAANAAGAQVHGPTLDLGGNHNWDALRGTISFPTPATPGSPSLQILQSPDGTNWYNTGHEGGVDTSRHNGGLQGGGSSVFRVKADVLYRYVRLSFFNDSNATTALVSSMALLTK